ncbi:MAG: ROK family protein [Phycisphaerae bacterium]
MTGDVAIGIDLGGTNVKVAAVNPQGGVVARRDAPLNAPRSPGAVVAQFADLARQLLADAGVTRGNVVGIGLGCPGPLNLRTATVIRSANLPGWSNVPIRDMTADATACAVTLDNDANLAALGEHWAGAGCGGDTVMLTLGTGVGGGIVLDGRVFHGHFDNAGELGHTIVEPGGRPCACGQHGCLEQYASATAITDRVAAAIQDGASSELAETVRRSGTVDARRVADAVRNEDPLCVRIWDDACRYLAIACVGLQHAFNPPRIVLGGGVSLAGDILFARVRRHLADLTWRLHDDTPDICPAKLGYDAGVIGAARCAWQAYSDKTRTE